MNHFDKMKKEIKMKPRGLKNFKKCLFRRDLKQSVMILFAGILLMALSAYAYDPLPVQYEGQKLGSWCGPASVTAVAIRFGIYPSGFGAGGQCVAASYIEDAGCCNSPLPSECDDAMSRKEGVKGYGKLGLSATDHNHGGTNPGLTEQAIEDEINAGRPFNIHWGRYPKVAGVCDFNQHITGGHWVVGTGWVEYMQMKFMWYMNTNGPTPNYDFGHFFVTYQWMKYGEDDECRRWSKSITIDSSETVPDDVMLKKTRQDNHYEFISDGKITAEEFVIKDSKTTFEASDQIKLEHGFKTENNAEFEARIVP